MKKRLKTYSTTENSSFFGVLEDLDNLRTTGLSMPADSLENLVDIIKRRIGALFFKGKKEYALVSFVGGTGTGKSSIFNALCENNISRTGVSRPQTTGALIYTHESCSFNPGPPFPGSEIRRFKENEPTRKKTSREHAYSVVTHSRKEMKGISLADTPDIDSLDKSNRSVADDIYLLSDVVVFVTSQEKYADEAPSGFLKMIQKEGTPFYVIFNKAAPLMTAEDAINSFRSQDIGVNSDRLFILPYIPDISRGSVENHSEFIRFRKTLLDDLTADTYVKYLEPSLERTRDKAAKETTALVLELENEIKAAETWMEELNTLSKSAEKYLFDQMERHFENDIKAHLKKEIRSIYRKYDVLGKPRRFLGRILGIPLRLAGFGRKKSADRHLKDLFRVGGKTDISPIMSALARFNRAVLDNLLPANSGAPLNEALRDPGIAVSEKYVKESIAREQEKMALWIEDSFHELMKGIPWSRELGIYATSVMGGALILSFEIILGGGFTFLDAAIDTLIAPLITDGSVRVFARGELIKIAKELKLMHRKNLADIIEEQRRRYEYCVKKLVIGEDTIGNVRDFSDYLERYL